MAVITKHWRNVFQDEQLNQTLKEDGIVCFDLPDFDAAGCDRVLGEMVPGYPTQFEDHFYGSVSLADLQLKRDVNDALEQLVGRHVNGLFTGHRLLTWFFLIKGIGENSILRLHQDWSILDERQYRQYNLWIPLVDCTPANGTLFAIRGSHRFPLNIRGAGIPAKYGDHFGYAEKFLEPFNVKAGQGLLFDSRVLHYSPPNHSGRSRTAVINNVIPEEAETTCFQAAGNNGDLIVREFNVPDDLFIHYDDFNNQKDGPNPKGIDRGVIDHANAEPVSAADFKQLIKTYANKKRWLFF